MKIFGLGRQVIMDAVKGGEVTVAVFGLGKMGLPLAAVFAEKGARVIGVDVNPAVAAEINRGNCPVTGEPGLPELIRKNVANGRLSATTDGSGAVKRSDVMVILVPSLLKEDNSLDLGAVTTACCEISMGLAKGHFVILETTVPPRTTRDVLLPILKRSGLKEGEFGLAFCPERTSSGRALRDILGEYIKVVGGIDERSTETAAAIYSVINEKGARPVSDATVAEAVKVFEGVYRDVNIALANELALVCKEYGINASEVFRVANEPLADNGHPYTVLLTPGAGVGGHCIPVYPYFVTNAVKTDTSVIKAARKKNEYMPEYMVEMAVDGLKEAGKPISGARVLVLGLTYRGGVKETRYTPAVPVIRMLKRLGAEVTLYDPLFTPGEVEHLGVEFGEDFQDMDCVVVVTDHREFKAYDWQKLGDRMRTKLIVDGRQVLNPQKAKNFGFIYRGI